MNDKKYHNIYEANASFLYLRLQGLSLFIS